MGHGISVGKVGQWQNKDVRQCKNNDGIHRLQDIGGSLDPWI